MSRYILDTDHLILLKRNHPIVRAKISSIPPADIFVTIVTIEEQLRVIRHSVRFAQLLPQLENLSRSMVDRHNGVRMRTSRYN